MTIESVRELQSRERVLPAIQYLRGIAAVMVVFGHSGRHVVEHAGGLEFLALPYGALGVAIFFIISGFIMYFTCRLNWDGSRASAANFLGRRFHRIIPLYWLMTTIQLAMMLVAGKGPGESGLSLRDILLSYLFIPYDYDGTNFRPILGVGWTLDFEMFFYALFAIGLLLPLRRGLPLIIAMILGFILIGQAMVLPVEPLAALAQPVIALFGIGILLGWARDRIAWRLAPAAGAALITMLTLGSPLLLFFTDYPEIPQLWFNPAVWGYALAFVIVGAFTRVPAERSMSWSAQLALALGDASYLLYLSHPIVLRVTREVAERLHLTSLAGLFATATVGFVASIVAALVGHVLVERRLIRWTAPLFGRKARARAEPDAAARPN